METSGKILGQSHRHPSYRGFRAFLCPSRTRRHQIPVVLCAAAPQGDRICRDSPLLRSNFLGIENESLFLRGSRNSRRSGAYDYHDRPLSICPPSDVRGSHIVDLLHSSGSWLSRHIHLRGYFDGVDRGSNPPGRQNPAPRAERIYGLRGNGEVPGHTRNLVTWLVLREFYRNRSSRSVGMACAKKRILPRSKAPG